MKTAVEWLLEELTMASFDQQQIAINKAKEMEKQQIVDAYFFGIQQHQKNTTKKNLIKIIKILTFRLKTLFIFAK